jgi:hypothetical protein
MKTDRLPLARLARLAARAAFPEPLPKRLKLETLPIVWAGAVSGARSHPPTLPPYLRRKRGAA